jgi:hypothetical protein
MTDQKTPAQGEQKAQPGKPVEAATAAPGEKRSTSRPLARASESGDPAVHKALADLQAAQMNAQAHQDAADQAKDAAEGNDEAVQKAKDALAELGYE